MGGQETRDPTLSPDPSPVRGASEVQVDLALQSVGMHLPHEALTGVAALVRRLEGRCSISSLLKVF